MKLYMQIRTYSATTDGLDGTLVEVEAALQSALPQIIITGLPGEVVKESRERVKASLSSLGFQVPSGRVLIHLSPATSKKQGSQFDLSIALSCLQAESVLNAPDLSKFAFLGELSLDGRLKPIHGLLPMVEACHLNPEIEWIIIPKGNESDVSWIRSAKIKTAFHLSEVIDFVRGDKELDNIHFQSLPQGEDFGTKQFDSIIGQDMAKKALAIAVAGRHHLLLMGPAGVGKSLLANSTPELLPPLSEEEIVELKKIYCTSEHVFKEMKRPFRSPHHGSSANALLGGGTGFINPGEVSLSHHGILFLDEFPEFKRDAIEGLREPLESGKIHVHRVGTSKTLPSNFTLIAAMNPCPCGNASNKCLCPPKKASSYRRKVSGPILDRMGLCIILAKPNEEKNKKNYFSGKALKTQIATALNKQKIRFASTKMKNGNHMRLDDYPDFSLKESADSLFKDLTSKNELSYRRMVQVKKVARTIADMEGAEWISEDHLWEAWGFRIPDHS